MRVPLTIGMYQARSIIASAQRCVNLFVEQNPQDSPYPFTTYPTPGTFVVTTAPVDNEVRGLYTATNGQLYAVVGSNVYAVDTGYTWTLLGTLTTRAGPVSMKDNSLVLVIVDGTANGYAVNLIDNAFGTITAPGFYGANKVDYLDTFFIFNKPGTNEFYISLSEVNFLNLLGGPALTGSITSAGSGYVNGSYTAVPLTGGTGSQADADIVVAGGVVTSVTVHDGEGGQNYRVGDVLSANNSSLGGAGTGFQWTVATIGSSSFDALDFASKVGGSDLLRTIAVMHREIWLIGFLTSEVWYDAGAPDFAFQAMPGAFVEHGAQATYSVAKYDLALFWLGEDQAGNSVVFQGSDYRVQQVSTHPIAKEISSYPVKNDAIGMTYMQEGHVYYVLTFPTADKTWVYDVTERHWHERAWADSEGNLHRWRPNCIATFNGHTLAGDFQNGKLYAIDLDTYQDEGEPIIRIRSFPQIVNDGKRISHRNLMANFQVGTPLATSTTDIPDVSLRASDTAGASWGNATVQSIGAVGEYLTAPQWNRLGLARDRVYELSWSAPMKTALNGVWLDVVESAS